MRIHRFFVMFILIAGITLLHGAPLWAGQIRLTWNAPTTNTNGTGLIDLHLYKIHYGTQSRGSTSSPAVFHYQSTFTLVASQTTYTITGLTEGVRYYFSVTAIDLFGNESQYSGEVNTVIPVSSGGGQTTTLMNVSFNSML
jgi:Fibronectin type III domain